MQQEQITQEHNAKDSNKLTPKIQERLDNLLEKEFVSAENGEAVKKFIHRLNAVRDDQISDCRLKKYISQFGQILPHANIELMEATIDDLLPVAEAINQQDVSPTTKRDRRVCLNKFYKTMFPVRERPNRVWTILESEVTNTSHPDQMNLKRQYDFIYPSEVLELSEAAGNFRDALIPLFFYCTGCRLEALQTVRLKDLKRHDTHITVTLNSQKNKKLRPKRDNHLTRCTHLLRQWLQRHPRSDDPEAYLFCTLQETYDKDGKMLKKRGDILSKKSIAKALTRLADRTGLDKPHNPHAFRYSMTTYYSEVEGWDVNDVADRGGWGSISQVREYILDLEKYDGRGRLLAQGIEPKSDQKLEALDMRVCGNCEEKLPPTQDLCSCGHALTDKIARETAEKEVVMVERNQKSLASEPDVF